MSGRPGRCGDSLETNRYAVLRNKSLLCRITLSANNCVHFFHDGK